LAVEIGHAAYRELESLPESDLDIRNPAAVRAWAYENNKRALFDWLSWRWDIGYLRGLEEGFEPTTLYFGIAVPEERSSSEQKKPPLMLTDEDGVRRLVLFSKFSDAKQYCVEQIALDEFSAKEQQRITGERIVPSSPARRWEVKAIPLSYLKKPNPVNKVAVLLDPAIPPSTDTPGAPGIRLTVTELEDND